MADKPAGLPKQALPDPPSRADASPTTGKRAASLKNATAVKQILNLGGSKSPASATFTSG